jgi:hypothetical protein
MLQSWLLLENVSHVVTAPLNSHANGFKIQKTTYHSNSQPDLKQSYFCATLHIPTRE